MFDIYKSGQGTWTRRLTMIGVGAAVALGAYYLYAHPLRSLGGAIFPQSPARSQVIQAIGAVLFLLGAGYLGFWLTYVRPGTGDFLIATEGEMKKVSWSSRKEIIGSTQVVIVTLVFMGLLLFVVDLAFMLLFHWAGVLKFGPFQGGS